MQALDKTNEEHIKWKWVINYIKMTVWLAVLFVAMEQLGYREQIRDKMSNVFAECGTRTRGKRLVREIILGVFGAQEARYMLAQDSLYRFA